MEQGGMDVTMQLTCRLAVVNRRGGVIEFSRGSIAVGHMSKKSIPSEEEPFLILRAAPKYTGTRYNLIGNIEHLSTEFLNQGHATVCLKEPSCNIFITKDNPKKLTEFISYFKQLLAAHSVMAASEPPTCRINLNLRFQEIYKLTMKNIIDMNINLDHFTELEISDCTLEFASYQVPIAGAIKKMKNLTNLRLEYIELHSSTFLEIESKELRKLHFCHCETQLPIAFLFKNDLCYKDSLVELHLEGNQWSEIPNGVFQFRNLRKLSLRFNLITELPDMFTNLSKLQELELHHNQLRSLPPSIFQMQNLLRISLSENFITELPDMFASSSKLQVLELSRNHLTHLPASIFALQNLSKLELDFNRITELPNLFANLSKLQVLKLSYNELTSVPPSIFQLQNLYELNLNGNLITSLPEIINLPMLNTLGLCDNQLTHLPPSIFALQNLSEFSLSDNIISDLPNVINLPKLEALELDNNQFRHMPSSIFDMQNLSGLTLDNNYITELPDKFINLPKLDYFSISNNQLQYLPPSIVLLNLRVLDIDDNEFDFDEIPPSFGSELIVHSLKELSYRTILNHKLIVEEGMLPKRFLNDLDNYKQCICGCKYVDEGQELSFFCNLNISSLTYEHYNRDSRIRVPIRGIVCTSLKSCFLDHFPKCR